MRRIDLAGEWSVRKAGAKKSILAAVPGCVHADLLSALEIEDPFLRRNLTAAAWVAESEWIYEKNFVAEDFSSFDRLALRFDGLSAGAEVALNDVVLGRTTNAFEAAEFEVKSLVKVGKNRLTVSFPPFSSVLKEGFRIQSSSVGAGAQPYAPTVGIGRGVALLAFSGVRVRDVAIRQDFGNGGSVAVDVSVNAEQFDPAMHVEVLARVCYKGNILYEARDILRPEVTLLRLTIKNPQLWWPTGLGDQPLYEVTVDVLAGRSCLEHVSRRIGLRQFAVKDDSSDGGEPLRFWVNKHPLFLKGASWLPADLYVARLTRVEYARLVKAAAVANVNVLRVWGGGVYENDAFYDLCDEYGICVWQDMMLSDCQSEEPTDEQRASFAREAQQQVCRLRHHPSLMMWCVGDRTEKGIATGYASAAAEAVSANDPEERRCLPALAHAPFSLNGEARDSSVPSYSAPCAVSAYLDEEDRNVSHPVCEFHVTPAGGTKTILSAFSEEFLMPCGFDNTVWLSQIQQGLAIKRQFESVRTAERPSAGFVFWHLNDEWPTCSPSSVDCKGRWKALHYMLRRFFAPLWLCGCHRQASGAVEIIAFNDGVKSFKGEVQWRFTLMEGSVVAEGAKKVSVPPAERDCCVSVKVAELLRKSGAENLMMWMYLLDEQGNQVAWNFVLFCPPRFLALQPPRMRAEIRTWDDNSFAVTLTSHRPALWVWLTLDGMDARFDDNFFCMEPEKACRVWVTPATRMKLDQFRQIIRIGSLRDTWQEKRGLMQMMVAPKK